jgi:hypothetical protein
MDDKHILEHLKKWAELFYGNLNSKYCFSRMKDEHYIFGFKKPNGVKKVNRITKALAIYLSVGVSPSVLEKLAIEKQGGYKVPETVPKKSGKTIRVPRINKPKAKRFRITE